MSEQGNTYAERLESHRIRETNLFTIHYARDIIALAEAIKEGRVPEDAEITSYETLRQPGLMMFRWSERT